MPDVPSEPEVVRVEQSYDVVVRTVPPAPAPTLAQRAAALRARLPELARHPVVVGTAAATAGIATGLAANVVRRALGGSAASGPTSVHVSGYVVHHIHVVQHVVHHVPRSSLPLPPGR